MLKNGLSKGYWVPEVWFSNNFPSSDFHNKIFDHPLPIYIFVKKAVNKLMLVMHPL